MRPSERTHTRGGSFHCTLSSPTDPCRAVRRGLCFTSPQTAGKQDHLPFAPGRPWATSNPKSDGRSLSGASEPRVPSFGPRPVAPGRPLGRLTAGKPQLRGLERRRGAANARDKLAPRRPYNHQPRFTVGEIKSEVEPRLVRRGAALKRADPAGRARPSWTPGSSAGEPWGGRGLRAR